MCKIYAQHNRDLLLKYSQCRIKVLILFWSKQPEVSLRLASLLDVAPAVESSQWSRWQLKESGWHINLVGVCEKKREEEEEKYWSWEQLGPHTSSAFYPAVNKQDIFISSYHDGNAGQHRAPDTTWVWLSLLAASVGSCNFLCSPLKTQS